MIVAYIAYKNITHIPDEKRKITSLKKDEFVVINHEKCGLIRVQIAFNDKEKRLFYYTTNDEKSGRTASIFKYHQMEYVIELKK